MKILYSMTIKKYKTLKSTSTILNLKNIAANSFFSLIQIKHLNHNEWLVLKQTIHPLGLNIFVCKNGFLNSKNSLFKLPKHIWDNLNQGNLAILYSKNTSISFLSSEFLLTDLFLKKIKASPLIFYVLNRFFFPKDFLSKVCKITKSQAFYGLICILQCHSYQIVDKLTLVNKLLLHSLNSKQL